MSIFDRAKATLSKAVDEHGNQIAQGLDKAASAADRKTGGKYSAKIQGGVAKAKDGLDKLDGQHDDITR